MDWNRVIDQQLLMPIGKLAELLAFEAIGETPATADDVLSGTAPSTSDRLGEHQRAIVELLEKGCLLDKVRILRGDEQVLHDLRDACDTTARLRTSADAVAFYHSRTPGLPSLPEDTTYNLRQCEYADLMLSIKAAGLEVAPAEVVRWMNSVSEGQALLPASLRTYLSSLANMEGHVCCWRVSRAYNLTATQRENLVKALLPQAAILENPAWNTIDPPQYPDDSSEWGRVIFRAATMFEFLLQPTLETGVRALTVLRDVIRQTYEGERPEMENVPNAFPGDDYFYRDHFWPLYLDSLLLRRTDVHAYCRGHQIPQVCEVKGLMLEDITATSPVALPLQPVAAPVVTEASPDPDAQGTPAAPANDPTTLGAWRAAVDDYENNHRGRANSALPTRMRILLKSLEGVSFSVLENDNPSRTVARDLRQARTRDIPELNTLFSSLPPLNVGNCP